MGATVVFTIPVALGIIEKEDRPYLAKGVLAGMVAIPFGCLVGGLVAGFPLMTCFKKLSTNYNIRSINYNWIMVNT